MRYSELEGAEDNRDKVKGRQRVVTLPGSSLGPQFGLFVDGKVRGTRCRYLN